MLFKRIAEGDEEFNLPSAYSAHKDGSSVEAGSLESRRSSTETRRYVRAVARGPPTATLAGPRRRPGARPVRAVARA